MIPDIPPGGKRIVKAPARPGAWLGWCDASIQGRRYSGGLVLFEPPGTSFERGLVFDEEGRDSTQAEILALKALLEWAREHTTRLIGMLDSYEALAHVLRAMADPRDVRYPETLLVVHLMDRFQELELRNVPRSKNKEADALAHKALQARPTRLFFSDAKPAA